MSGGATNDLTSVAASGRMSRVLAALAATTVALAGCLAPASETLAPASAARDLLGDLPLFGEPLVVDEVRAGGEPVLAITPKGTILVSAHPGFTHYHPTSPTNPGLELLTPVNAQSYLWRSADGGATWTHVGLPGLEQGPRSAGLGVSDPEFTVMEDGTVCYTDLEGLAMSSVSCSTDDGLTWVGNPVASQRPNDRQWLASHGDELYFTANFFTDHALLASTDRGLTWERRGDTLCSGDLVANPRTGVLFVGCGDGVSVSNDGGATFEERRLGVDTERAMTEPAIDAADTVWMAYTTAGERELHLVGTTDEGLTWPHALDLTPGVHDLAEAATGAREHAFVWPWVSAGSAGRVAVSWIGAHTPDYSGDVTPETEWRVYTAYVVGADTATPEVALVEVTPDPIHLGAICQAGTSCQVASMQGDPYGDRRLGDFFETTIDAEGDLHLAFSNTAAQPEDVISHPMYVKQVGGLPLLVAGDRMPTQG